MFPENLYSRTVINILLPEYHVVREASRLHIKLYIKQIIVDPHEKKHRANSTPPKFNKSFKIPRGREGS